MNVTKQTTDSSRSIRAPFDSLTLRAVVVELAVHLVGGQIQEVRQPSPNEVLLGVRNHGRNYLLLLSIDARFARAHLTTTRRPNPQTPPNFCMVLRKHVEDRWIRGIDQVGFDRILTIQVGDRNEPDAGGEVTIVAELMGKHSNLILVNELGATLDCVKRVTRRINRFRETLPGLAYQAPPEQPDRLDPFLPGAVEHLVRELPGIPPGDRTSMADAIRQIFAGISPFLADELAERAYRDPAVAPEDALRLAWNAVFAEIGAGRLSPVQIRDDGGKPVGAYAIPVLHLPDSLQEPIAELNSGLDAGFTETVSASRLMAMKAEVSGKIEREVKRLERQLNAASTAVQEAGRAEEYKRAGELLLANLWKVKPGDQEVRVQDYYDPDLHERVIHLDPKLSAQDNVDGYFRRYRKARDGVEKERARGLQAQAQLAVCRAAQEELKRLGAVEAAQSLRDELLRRGVLRAADETADRPGAHESEFQGHRIRRHPTPEGFEILIGESATANDFLTTRIAGPNDLWLHVRAAASAHVVIRTHGQPSAVPRTVLERAAILCAQHSAQKHSSLVSVDYTLKKYVRKPRGSAPGGADYQKESTIDVTP